MSFIIIGPTASGKTLLAHELAKRINGSIINADSMQVYRELPCLSAQPDMQFRENIPYHLFGYRTVTQHYSAGHWYRDAILIINNTKKQQIPILVGGTGMYLKVLMNGIIDCPPADDNLRRIIRDTIQDFSPATYHSLIKIYNPQIVERIKPNDRLRLLRAVEVWLMTKQTTQQLQYTNTSNHPKRDDFFIITVMPTKDELYHRINQRFIEMIDSAAVEEVQNLLSLNLTPHHPAMKMIGVPQIADFLTQKITKPQMIELASQASRRYAKRQMTWLRHQVTCDFNIPYVVTKDNLVDVVGNIINAGVRYKP